MIMKMVTIFNLQEGSTCALATNRTGIHFMVICDAATVEMKDGTVIGDRTECKKTLR